MENVSCSFYGPDARNDFLCYFIDLAASINFSSTVTPGVFAVVICMAL